MRRIYSLRCSIVHSNPDYDKSHSIVQFASINSINLCRLLHDLIIFTRYHFNGLTLTGHCSPTRAGVEQYQQRNMDSIKG